MGQRLDLDDIFRTFVVNVYFQTPTKMVYPCIKYEPYTPSVADADNIKYNVRQGYSVTVIDRNPDSPIPAQVLGLPHAQFDRYYRADGLHHNVYQLYY